MRKKCLRLAPMLCVFPVLGACTTRPDARDLPPYRLDAALIAQSIRCETRDGVITILNEALVGTTYEGRLTRDHFLKIAVTGTTERERNLDRARQEAEAFETFLKSGYLNEIGDPELKPLIETYRTASIAYKFEFDIATTDVIEGSVDLTSAFTGGTVKSPIGAGVTGKRQAKRGFVELDRFDQLLTNRPTIRTCNDLRAYKRLPNSVYPITGELGIIDIIRDFGTANQSGNLIGQYSDVDLLQATQKLPVPTMSERLVYTTTVKGGISPVLEINPPLDRTKITGASLKLSRERVDIHTLTLILQLPELKGPPVATARSNAEREAEQTLYKASATAAANELNRIENEDRRNRLLNVIIGP